jgi:tRNA-specific 2-thiouridylase
MARSRDDAKDQTYFLFGLKQEQLARTFFPLGGFTKPQVRELAREIGLPVAEKHDSQEICFVPNGDYAAFIEAYFRELGVEPGRTQGEIVTSEGRVVGEHSGVHHFTIGQRRGLRVAAREPLYVIRTEPEAQRVVVGRGEELLRARMRVKDVNWISIEPIVAPRRAEVKIRNKHMAAPATVFPVAGEPASVEVLFDEPQRAITPGQGAVMYDGEFVLGGGWIA